MNIFYSFNIFIVLVLLLRNIFFIVRLYNLQARVHMRFRLSMLISFDSMKGFFCMLVGFIAPEFLKIKSSFQHIFRDEITGCQAVFLNIKPNNKKQSK